jgi:hypothetical protein
VKLFEDADASGVMDCLVFRLPFRPSLRAKSACGAADRQTHSAEIACETLPILGESMPTMRYIQITSQEPIRVIDVVTQIHYLLTPGEGANPDAKFWDLTIGGEVLSSGDQRDKVHLLSSTRVAALFQALQTLSWESLEAQAKMSLDMMPGWHVRLQPEFENSRFLRPGESKGYAISDFAKTVFT